MPDKIPELDIKVVKDLLYLLLPVPPDTAVGVTGEEPVLRTTVRRRCGVLLYELRGTEEGTFIFLTGGSF